MVSYEKRPHVNALGEKTRVPFTTESNLSYSLQIVDYVTTHKEKLEQTVSGWPLIHGVSIAVAILVIVLCLYQFLAFKRSLYK